MWKISGAIIRWWYSHNLDQVESILSSWKPGFIFTRIKFEIATIILDLIALIKGVSLRNDPSAFIAMSLGCKEEY